MVPSQEEVEEAVVAAADVVIVVVVVAVAVALVVVVLATAVVVVIVVVVLVPSLAVQRRGTEVAFEVVECAEISKPDSVAKEEAVDGPFDLQRVALVEAGAVIVEFASVVVVAWTNFCRVEECELVQSDWPSE